MALARGELWFAPGRRMADVNLENPGELIDSFRDRVLGFYIEPARHLRTMDQEESSLFASALMCAATIESIAHSDPSLHNSRRPIADWLLNNISQFRQNFRGNSVAAYFENRFRNSLVHEGYISSLGRLGTLEEIVTIDGQVVTINPFLLIEAIVDSLDQFSTDLKSGQRDIRAFQYLMKNQFMEEVQKARADAV